MGKKGSAAIACCKGLEAILDRAVEIVGLVLGT